MRLSAQLIVYALSKIEAKSVPILELVTIAFTIVAKVLRSLRLQTQSPADGTQQLQCPDALFLIDLLASTRT